MKPESEGFTLGILILVGLFTVILVALYLNHLEILEKIRLAPDKNVQTLIH